MLRLLLTLATTACLLAVSQKGVKAAMPVGTGGPSLIYEGKDALLTCVVSENIANNTVIWKKGDEILTAGMVRVTSDQRVRVLHDENPKGGKLESGGEVWVLLIKNLKASDTGSYICEINSEPVLRSIHILKVKALGPGGAANANETVYAPAASSDSSDVFLVPPPLDSGENRSYWRPSSSATPQIVHDFTECCEHANVSTQCMGFCNVHNILDGTTGIEPEACEKDFPQIVRCMVDGRNHVPCCVEKQVPDLCQDMCRGEYSPITDLLKTRVSCIQHTLNSMQCILQGVQLIPSEPQDVNIEDVSETMVTLSWMPPAKLADKVQHYSVNITALRNFDDDNDNADASQQSAAVPLTKSILRTVPANQTTLSVSDLMPLTMYSIELVAVNDFGSSLVSERLRFVTHKSISATEHEAGMTSKTETPQLPDVRSCCESHGMRHRTCLDKMCDPTKTDLATLPDFMVCAPWSNITFTCLTNKMDHTECCRARGIPSVCHPLCSGAVTTLDFSLFRCLRFMSEYSSCLLQGYGVLAGPPSKMHAIAKTDNFIILDWNKPKRLPETVNTYHVKFRRLFEEAEYFTVEKQTPPLILEGLKPDTEYEFYVVSVNSYGKSEPSPRLIVRTPSPKVEDNVESTKKYNITTCCIASGLLPQCTPLCTYDLRMSDIEKLGPACRAQMSVFARCAAGGRDHTPCCQRRGVVPACMSLCRGVMPVMPLTTGTPGHPTTASSAGVQPDCLTYAGNILQCFEEGTEQIPGPPEDVHATLVTNSSISLAWSQPEVEADNNLKAVSSDDITAAGDDAAMDAMPIAPLSTPSTAVTAAATTAATTTTTKAMPDIDYIVQYGKVNNMTMYETVAKLENELYTNETSIELENLESNALYRIMVMTRGKFGTSLPASMLLINTTTPTINTEGNIENANKTYGAPSPPHSLAIVAQSATWMQLTWQPPEYSHPHEKITYRIYHKPMKAEKFTQFETKLAWFRMNNLKPSSQHIFYVEAIGEHATSLPSETLVAWTDPALPAFVDPPTVHPADNIPEGGSMTILCLAFGNPAPTISLYVGGKLVRQDTLRHMVTVMYNVTADMEHVSCYADNGYGVPMQATRRVNICYPPKIQAAGITVASVGDEVELRCTVDAKPKPKTFFWRDHDGRIPVIHGGNYYISERTDVSRPSVYVMSLRINKMQATDVGDYFCHAENPYGSSTIPVSVRIRNTPALNRNVSACCAAQNVSLACRTACSYYVDFDAIADRPECIVDFDKLMYCAADGSDHRPCCAEATVPRKCLNWCRGDAVRSKEICSLQWSRTIVGCFEKNRERLPGPPENIAVSVVSDSEVVVRWDPPVKNPNGVEGYRIFYHEAAILANDSGDATMNNSDSNNATSMLTNMAEIRRLDVKDTTVTLEGLKKDVLYELVVKASNTFGASILTDPIKFTLGEHHVTSATTTYSHAVGTISGIVASILAILLAIAAIIFYRRHRANGKAGNGVAFENPTYTRGLEQVQTLCELKCNGLTNFSIPGRSYTLPACQRTAAGGVRTAAITPSPSPSLPETAAGMRTASIMRPTVRRTTYNINSYTNDNNYYNDHSRNSNASISSSCNNNIAIKLNNQQQLEMNLAQRDNAMMVQRSYNRPHPQLELKRKIKPKPKHFCSNNINISNNATNDNYNMRQQQPQQQLQGGVQRSAQMPQQQQLALHYYYA